MDLVPLLRESPCPLGGRRLLTALLLLSLGSSRRLHKAHLNSSRIQVINDWFLWRRAGWLALSVLDSLKFLKRNGNKEFRLRKCKGNQIGIHA